MGKYIEQNKQNKYYLWDKYMNDNPEIMSSDDV